METPEKNDIRQISTHHYGTITLADMQNEVSENNDIIYYTPDKYEFVFAVIYKWTNLVNGMSYIGQTINECERYRKHVQEPFNPNSRSYNYHFHRAIRKYGIENFHYSVLSKMRCPKCCAKEILNAQEQYYIKLYDTYKNGYNMTLGGDGNNGRHMTEEQRKRQSEILKGRFAGKNSPTWGRRGFTQAQKDGNYTPVLKYTIDGELVGEYESLKAAAISVGVSHSHTGNISNCCRGERNKAYGYIWKYKQ
jgi:group I intron endonuclease